MELDTGRALEYHLLIHGGPADGERINTLVEPGNQRWFLEQKGSDVTWWWMGPEAPPPDPDVEITLYSKVGSRVHPGFIEVNYEPDSQFDG